jgi:CheY-like chemotaxis protein
MIKNRILIVEDDAVSALSLKITLAKRGYEICDTVDTGEEAIATALKLQPDLILMDIFLAAQIDGVEAVKKIHEHLDVPIIYVSASSDQATYQRACQTKMVAFLRKPYNNRQLLELIKKELTRLT